MGRHQQYPCISRTTIILRIWLYPLSANLVITAALLAATTREPARGATVALSCHSIARTLPRVKKVSAPRRMLCGFFDSSYFILALPIPVVPGLAAFEVSTAI